MSEYEQAFEEGDTANLGAGTPTAKIERVFEREGKKMYEITWSNGNETENPCSRIDGMAKNTGDDPEVVAYSCELHTPKGHFDKLTHEQPEELYDNIPNVEVKNVKELMEVPDE